MDKDDFDGRNNDREDKPFLREKRKVGSIHTVNVVDIYDGYSIHRP